MRKALKVALASLAIGGVALEAGTSWVLPKAQAQVSRQGIVGGWIWDDYPLSSSEGDAYEFEANGTYVFFAGPAKRATGNLEHGGTWTLLDGGRTLRLHATRRVVLEGGRRRALLANRLFRLSIAPTGGNSIRIAGEQFRR